MTNSLNFTVPDICDAYPKNIRIGNIFLKSFGGVSKFFGQIRTANCPHSNSVVKEMVNEDGSGMVLFINHSGSDLCSMFGDQIAQTAYADNSVGIGTKDETIILNNMDIIPGEWIYVDTNGWVLTKEELKL